MRRIKHTITMIGVIRFYDILKQKKKALFLILVLIFGFFYIFGHIFRYADISTAGGGVQEEFILEYIAGKNFVLKGFNSLFFLQDYSSDFRKDSQPIIYTHNPPLPSIIQGLLIKIGLNIFQSRIIYAFISLSGIIFLYLFINQIASISAAVFSSVLLIINFSGYLSLADHNHYSLGFPLLFIYLWLRHLSSLKKYIFIPVIFLIISLTSYMLLIFILLLEFSFFIYQKDKKLFLTSVGAAISGIIIHIIQNMIVLTPVIAWQDMWLTIQNRLYALPSRHELLSFYQNHNLVLWGTDKLLIQEPINSYIHSILIPFLLFKTPLIIAIISAFIFYIARQGNFYKNRRILMHAFWAVIIWHISIVQTIGGYPPIFHIFLAIFFGIILSDLLYALVKNFHFGQLLFKDIATKTVILLAIIIIIFKYLIWAGGYKNDDSLSKLLKTLENYQEKTFFTNIHSPLTVSLKTRNWTIGGCLPEGLLNLNVSHCYSKLTALKSKELIPDYILLSSRSFAFDCPPDCFSKLKNDLSKRYQLMEEADKGENIIFKVKKIKGLE